MERLRSLRWPLTVGVLLLALVGGLLIWRPASPPAPPAAAVIVYTPTPHPTEVPLPTATPPPIVVYVSGAVVRPGVYTLPAGARLADAVAAAGGAAAQADLDQVNLARRLQDEEHVHIPRWGETPRPEPTPLPGGTAPSGPSGGKVNINTAGLAELDSLPGIGPGYAQRIIEYRQAHGPFSSIEELLNVPGIGPATFARIRDLITVK